MYMWNGRTVIYVRKIFIFTVYFCYSLLHSCQTCFHKTSLITFYNSKEHGKTKSIKYYFKLSSKHIHLKLILLIKYVHIKLVMFNFHLLHSM